MIKLIFDDVNKSAKFKSFKLYISEFTVFVKVSIDKLNEPSNPILSRIRKQDRINKQKKNDISPSSNSSNGERPLKNNLNKKPLLIKPLNKPETPKIILNQPKNANKPTIFSTNSQTKTNLRNPNLNNKPYLSFSIF